MKPKSIYVSANGYRGILYDDGISMEVSDRFGHVVLRNEFWGGGTTDEFVEFVDHVPVLLKTMEEVTKLEIQRHES